MESRLKTIRRILCFCVCLGLAFQVVLPVSARAAEAEKTVSEYRWITKREEVDGGDYTSDPTLAEKLNEIFDGSANVYYDPDCTKMVNTALGTYRVPNNGVYKYVGKYGDNQMDIGTSCWIYANGVYFTLFGEGTGCGTPGEHSEKLDLSTTANKRANYENFTAWGVRPGVGALIRSKDGHSMIVLDYDEEQLTVLDGNGDGKGLVSIRVRTWDRLYFSVSYIIQPDESYVEELYPEDGNASEAVSLSVVPENMQH